MITTYNRTNATMASEGYTNNVESMDYKITKAFAATSVMLVAVVGNSLVIAAVGQNPRIQTVTNYLIVNMAVADLLYILIVMPPFYIQIFEFHEWAMGSYGRGVYFCKIVHFCQYFFVIVSVLTLACIGIDRFFAIVVPLRKVFTKKVFRVIVPAIWLIAAVVAAPLIYAQKIKDDDGFLSCEEDWSPAFETRKASRVYSAMLFAIVFCVPFFAITVMYTIICKKLWQRKIPGEMSVKRSKTVIKLRKKVVKMLIAVVIAFVICWLPVQIATFLWEYEPDLIIPPVIYFICTFLMRAHASVSPCIYAVFSENYRVGFKGALTYCWYGNIHYNSTVSRKMFESGTRKSTIKDGRFKCRKDSNLASYV